jgi:cobaltochelatase CobT
MKAHNLTHELQQTAGVFGRQKETNVVFEADGQENTTAYTDGKTIMLPALPDNLEFSHEETMVMRGYLDHEAGHVRHTDFEQVQAFSETQSQQAFTISNCLEDVRLEGLVMNEYPGARKNLTKLREHVGAKELDYIKKNPQDFTTITAAAIQNAIIRAGTLEYGGKDNQEMFDMMPERFQAWGKKFAEEARACKDTKEILNLSLAIEKLLEESLLNQPPKPMPKEGEEDGEGQGLDGNPSDFEFDKNGDPTEGKPRSGRGKPTGKPVDAQGKRMLSDLIEQVKDDLQSKVDGYMKEAKPVGTDYRVLSTRYDEVFTNKSSGHSRVEHRHDYLKNNSAMDYEKTKNELGGLVNTMKAKLRRALMAKETRDWDFGREFGKLDTKRLVAGSLRSPTVYKQRKERLEMDTAVHFLIDLSGSMGGYKIKVARDTAVAFSECLEGTPIRYQITGFCNSALPSDLREAYNRASRSGQKYHRVEPLSLFKFKDFNSNLQLAKGSINAIGQCSGGNNSDRDAVIWAYHELMQRPEKRKILFVLSDGQPANDTINIDAYSARGPLVAGLKLAIDECGKNGVECVGVGILTDHVKTIYPKSVSIEQVQDLSGAVFTQLSNLLTGGKVRL